ncbi:hypothetical protein EVAR_3716_1 [Eumeta japonica]|uniref:Mariner Mos1 transposase n=1 Tax=Eumeta variegata TaxID=151549 RepID=A0A4C1SRM7_EUMVA|nr:hypothetical protein EVAR_3716_1 [Eumeta japonica]
MRHEADQHQITDKLELNQCDHRAMIYYDHIKGLKWQQFLIDWLSLIEDEEARTGRPPTAVTRRNQAVEELIQENRRITYVELEPELCIGSPGMQTIIQDHLSLRNRWSKWVPHELTDEQKDRRVD